MQQAALFSDANRQVQIADHLLTVTYPMVKDPKLLISVMEHARRAIEDACAAVVESEVEKKQYVKKHTDALASFKDTHIKIDAAQEAVALCYDLRLTLKQHKESPVTFSKEEKLVIAGEGFGFLKEVTPAELKRSIVIVKKFVHAANKVNI